MTTLLVPIIWFALLFVLWRYGPKLLKLVRERNAVTVDTQQTIYDTKFWTIVTDEMHRDRHLARFVRRSRR